MNTVPTGVAVLPPVGPATPVVATAQSVCAMSRTRCDICVATGAETAPSASKLARSMPKAVSFARYEYVTTARSK